MKALLATFILTLGLSGIAMGQRTTTATMQISATVISGATLTNSQYINIDLKTNIMTGGTIVFKAPNQADTQISIDSQLILRNEYGETITYDSQTLHQVIGDTHILELLTNPTSNEPRSLSGSFRGELIASVNYL